MDSHNIALGKRGEEQAVILLKKSGYRILERNYKIRNGEIDIICLDASARSVQSLVFIEVKTRTSGRFGTPFEAITLWKIQVLRRTAQFYKATHKNLPELLRIDAIAVLFDENGEVTVEHMKNVC